MLDFVLKIKSDERYGKGKEKPRSRRKNALLLEVSRACWKKGRGGGGGARAGGARDIRRGAQSSGWWSWRKGVISSRKSVEEREESCVRVVGSVWSRGEGLERSERSGAKARSQGARPAVPCRNVGRWREAGE